MFNGIKNRFQQFRYGDVEKRRKMFWILSVGTFLIIIVVWLVFFSNIFYKIKPETPGTDSKSIWQDIGGELQSFTSSIGQITSQAFNATSTSTSTNATDIINTTSTPTSTEATSTETTTTTSTDSNAQ
jgi:hypothetical protein